MIFIYIFNIVLYILLGLLVVWYFYILIFNRKKTSPSFGRKKKVIVIINKNLDIVPRATRKIESAVKEMGELFYKNGDIDYETLLDTLMSVKKEQENDRFTAVIDIFCKNIQMENPYLHISNTSAELIKRLAHDIEKGHSEQAAANLKLLYENIAETEKALKRRGKKEFWVGTVIGLLGIVISLITFSLQ